MREVKPDPAAFTRVTDELGMAPDRILLLDDNQLNVDGARAAGLRAERVIGVEEARRVLERVTALPPGPSD
jgi:putative hydrolase of the HAD superfamily